jgi:hypothetical protein
MKWPCSGPNSPSALSSSHQKQVQQCMQGTYCGGWRRCARLDAKIRVLAVGALASTTCNNFIADLLFLSEVSHSFRVAAPCVHPYLGEWALGGGWWKQVEVEASRQSQIADHSRPCQPCTVRVEVATEPPKPMRALDAMANEELTCFLLVFGVVVACGELRAAVCSASHGLRMRKKKAMAPSASISVRLGLGKILPLKILPLISHAESCSR